VPDAHAGSDNAALGVIRTEVTPGTHAARLVDLRRSAVENRVFPQVGVTLWTPEARPAIPFYTRHPLRSAALDLFPERPALPPFQRLSYCFLHCTASYPVGWPSPSCSSVAAVKARTTSDVLGNLISQDWVLGLDKLHTDTRQNGLGTASQLVAPKVAGSSPVGHPPNFRIGKP
jgi:hypothetical protein